MNETPERIEREMFEIRSCMASEINDLRKRLESRIVAEQVRQTIRQRLSQLADHGKANLKAKQQDLAYSAKRSLSLARHKISNTRGE